MDDDGTQSEQWLPVAGYEGSYEISDLGRVQSLTRWVSNGVGLRAVPGQILAATVSETYKEVKLRSPGRRQWRVRVHVLVATMFLGPRPAGLEVRHLNGDSCDNRLTNLAWGTRTENEGDKQRLGTHPGRNKQQCRLGHALAAPNLSESKARSGHRNCLACGRAGNVVRTAWARHGIVLDLKSEADRQYRSLIASPGRRQGKAVGEHAGNAVMTEALVVAMRRDHDTGQSERKLAISYGIGKSQVHNIVTRKSWQHVP